MREQEKKGRREKGGEMKYFDTIIGKGHTKTAVPSPAINNLTPPTAEVFMYSCQPDRHLKKGR